MHTLESIRVIVAKCQFKDWMFHVDDKTGSTPFLQIRFYDKDFYTGKPELQYCRKWQLSYHMVDIEIVRTAHKAVRAAMEHEVDEQFKYDDAVLFHPHHDLEAMVAFAKRKKISVRTPPKQVDKTTK